MDLQRKDYDKIKEQGTGIHGEISDYKIITFPFDKYEISVKLTATNEFLEIVEVKINKDFLSHKQKIISQGYHDVTEFYKE